MCVHAMVPLLQLHEPSFGLAQQGGAARWPACAWAVFWCLCAAHSLLQEALEIHHRLGRAEGKRSARSPPYAWAVCVCCTCVHPVAQRIVAVSLTFCRGALLRGLAGRLCRRAQAPPRAQSSVRLQKTKHVHPRLQLAVRTRRLPASLHTCSSP